MIVDKRKNWVVPRVGLTYRQARWIWNAAAELPVIECDPRDWPGYEKYAASNPWISPVLFRNVVEHVRATLRADLRYPVIVTRAGKVLDGAHRLIRCIVENRPLRYVVLNERPPSDDDLQIAEGPDYLYPDAMRGRPLKYTVRMNDRELLALRDHVSAVRHLDGVYLEIGVAWAGSMAAVYTDYQRLMVGIDPWMWESGVGNHCYRATHHEPTGDPYMAALENLEIAGVPLHHAEMIRATNDQVLATWTRPIAALFVDEGTHKYESSKIDCEFIRHVLPGGAILFHNYENLTPGLIRAVDEAQAEFGLIFVEQVDSLRIFRR